MRQVHPDLYEAFKAYCIALLKPILEEAEKAFDEFGMNVQPHRQAAGECGHTHDCQPRDEPGQDFVLAFQFSAMSRRAKCAETWSESADENIERLSKYRFVMDDFVQKCRNCNSTAARSTRKRRMTCAARPS